MQREFDEIDVLLDLWADWMRRPPAVDTDSDIAVGFMKGTLKDSEELQATAEAETISRVDAAYESLAPIYKDAINRRYKLGSRVWRFAKDVTFEDAKEAIKPLLSKKGLI